MGLQDNGKDAYRRDSLAYGSKAVISVEVRLRIHVIVVKF